MKQKFNITGMTCSACSSGIEKNVSKLKNVENAEVSLLTNSMNVEYKEGFDIYQVIDLVKKMGYGISLEGGKNKQVKEIKNDEYKTLRVKFIFSLIFLIPLFYISMGHMMKFPFLDAFHGVENAINLAFTQFLLILPIVFLNRNYFINGYKNLIKKSPNMDTLIAIGSSAALIYGIYAIYIIGYGLGNDNHEIVKKYTMDLYFESAAMILTLITLGKYLESRSKGKTSEAISKLMKLTPNTAIVLKNDIEVELSVDDIKKEEILIIKTGQNIPLDGEIIEGNVIVDESLITGESIPINKNVGMKLIAGTINTSGFCKMKVTEEKENSTVSKIIKLIEEAASSKAPISKLADKISGFFVPVVIAISFISFIVWMLLGYEFSFAISMGISVLVISCPCALGLATPTAIMVGTGKGAENGVLIKSAESLEILHGAKTVVLDKTGTITEGKPKVTDVILSEDITEEELFFYASSIEKLSQHPISKAIINFADEKSYNYKLATDYELIEGYGIKAKLEDNIILAGNEKLMNNYEIDTKKYENTKNKLSNQGKTILYFAKDKLILGIIAVADTIKDSTYEAIKKIKEKNIEVIMLTGDNSLTAKYIGEKLKIDKIFSEVLPSEKEIIIKKLQSENKKVVMIGDGVNDAPALTRADIGVAIGAGTDIAIKSADIILIKNDLNDFIKAFNLSRATLKTIKQNLFWAFFYNIIGIPLAAGVLFIPFDLKLNPMFAAAAMSLSSVFVVMNALRLKTIKVDRDEKIIQENSKTFTIDGMSCLHCSSKVENALLSVNNIKRVEINLDSKLVKIFYVGDVSDKLIENKIVETGFKFIK